MSEPGTGSRPQAAPNPWLWFTFEERFEGSLTRKAWSPGGGTYYDSMTTQQPKVPLFEVLKDHGEGKMWVTVKSITLRVSLSLALGLRGMHTTDEHFTIDYRTVLKRYRVLKNYLEEQQKRCGSGDPSARELKLLLQDLLLDREVFSGFALEDIRSLSVTHWQDMQLHSTERDLDDIDSAVKYRFNYGKESRGISRLIRQSDLPGLINFLEGPHAPDSADLTTALIANNIDAFWILLTKGADWHLFQESYRCYDRHPIVIATKQRNAAVVRSLILRASREDRQSILFEKPILHGLLAATYDGNIEMVKLFLDESPLTANGSELHQLMYGIGFVGSLEQTPPLLIAAKRGHLNLVRYLTERGANVNQKVSSQCFHSSSCGAGGRHSGFHTALLCAASNGHHKIVKYLIESGANVTDNVSWDMHFNPLAVSAVAGHCQVVQCLLAHGASMASIHKTPDTPFVRSKAVQDLSAFEWTIRKGRSDIIQILCKYGLDVTVYPQERLVQYADLSPSPCMKQLVKDLYRDKAPLSAAGSLLKRVSLLNRLLPWTVEPYPEIDAYIDSLIARESASAPLDDEPPPLPETDQDMLGESPPGLSSFSKVDEWAPVYSCSLPRPARWLEPPNQTICLDMHAEDLGEELYQNFQTCYHEFLFRILGIEMTPELTDDLYRSYNVWDTGISSIRLILRGQLPQSLKNVISCLLVATAMRMTGKPMEYEGLPVFCGPEEFLDDFDRWMLMVPERDRDLYRKIVDAVWDRPPSNARNSPIYSSDETLVCFQELLSSLISGTRIPQVDTSSHDSGGSKLHLIPKIHQDSLFASRPLEIPVDNVTPLVEPGGITECSPNIDTGWQQQPPMVILIAAGAIFSVIISFLLILRLSATPLYREWATSCSSSPGPRNCEELNLRNLTWYLGVMSVLPAYLRPDAQLSPADSATISNAPSIANSENSSTQGDNPHHWGDHGRKLPRFRCQHCTKTFSNRGNLNKHLARSCKSNVNTKQAQCPRCERVYYDGSYLRSHTCRAAN